ncbi:uncharacterized protein LOC119181680 isoform X2 [Rhipicephalus microplus]|uniref:uncharacterized protein LOC119181680 isoform X2 n=1 Tax=Rhipicephalus microplus TaxID=6941 RepID=UPI003F6BD418
MANETNSANTALDLHNPDVAPKTSSPVSADSSSDLLQSDEETPIIVDVLADSDNSCHGVPAIEKARTTEVFRTPQDTSDDQPSNLQHRQVDRTLPSSSPTGNETRIDDPIPRSPLLGAPPRTSHEQFVRPPATWGNYLRNPMGAFNLQQNVAYGAHSPHYGSSSSIVQVGMPGTSRTGWHPVANAYSSGMEGVAAIWWNERNPLGYQTRQPNTLYVYKSRARFGAASAAPSPINSSQSMTVLQGERRPDNEAASTKRPRIPSAMGSAQDHPYEGSPRPNVTAQPTMTGSSRFLFPPSFPSTSRGPTLETMLAHDPRNLFGTLRLLPKTAQEYANMARYGSTRPPPPAYNSSSSTSSLQDGRRPDNEGASIQRPRTSSATGSAPDHLYEGSPHANVTAQPTITGSSRFPFPLSFPSTSRAPTLETMQALDPRNPFGTLRLLPKTAQEYANMARYGSTRPPPPAYNSSSSTSSLQDGRRPDNEGASIQSPRTPSAPVAALSSPSEDTSRSNVTAHLTQTGSSHLPVPPSFPSTSQATMGETMQAYDSRNPFGTPRSQPNTAQEYANMAQYGSTRPPPPAYNSRNSKSSLQDRRRPDNEGASIQRTPYALWRPFEDTSRSIVTVDLTQTESSHLPVPPSFPSTSQAAMVKTMRAYDSRSATGSTRMEQRKHGGHGNFNLVMKPSRKRPYACDTCEKSFVYQWQLEQHRFFFHKGIKP